MDLAQAPSSNSNTSSGLEGCLSHLGAVCVTVDCGGGKERKEEEEKAVAPEFTHSC